MKKFIALILALVLVFAFVGCGEKPAETSGEDAAKQAAETEDSKSTATDGKKALLVVSFGTSYNDTRKVTLDAIEELYKEKYADYDVYRAFTAQIIIDKLQDRDGLDVMNLEEAFEMLKKEGYSDVVIQSLHVMDGAEFHDVVATAYSHMKDFNDIKIGMGLLTSVEDYKLTAKALSTTFPSDRADDHAVVLMGHGTHHPANATYSCMEEIFESEGYENVFVGTVEGFPTFDDVVRKLKAHNIKKVTLMPMMMVAGDHASNDMAGDEEDAWKVMLKKEGFDVEIYLHGMGEIQGIRDIFLDHTKKAIEGHEKEGH